MDNIWEDFFLHLHTENIENTEKNICGTCKHTIISVIDGFETCEECGLLINELVTDSCEWNDYNNNDGIIQKDLARSDKYISDNPYDKNGSIPNPFKNNRFAMKLHYQQVFSHKQKVFWQTVTRLDELKTILNLNNVVLNSAKDMWHICMESGILTRASVRNGLIGSCLYYSCVHNNVPIERSNVIKGIDCSNKGFLKGEKIFCEVMKDHTVYKNLFKLRLDIKKNNSFKKYVQMLELPVIACEHCEQIFDHLKEDKLEEVTPKSAIAGILLYVSKNILKYKNPSKNKVCEVVGVCIPTINKVLSIITLHYKK